MWPFRQTAVWVLGSYGLLRYDGGEVYLFDEADGLPAKTGTNRALIGTADGRVWAGTVKGAAVFRQGSGLTRQTPPPVFTSLKVNGQAVSPFVGEGSELPKFPNNPYLEASFIALSYPNDQTVYQYRLSGKPWSSPSRLLLVTLPTIRTGSHVFEVRAKQKGAYSWSGPASYRFEVLKPWFLTGWAFLSYFLVAGGLVYGISKVQAYRLAMQRAALEAIIEARTEEIRDKNAELELKNKAITDSISYAKDIQRAVTPEKSALAAVFSEYFVMYYPKDIVSGDFFWFTQVDRKLIIAVVDCTGHGVPGAFMSMIGHILLNEIVALHKVDSPAEILERFHQGVRKALKQDERKNDDGMDAGICAIPLDEAPDGRRQAVFAGAKTPIIFIKDGVIKRIRGENRRIGGGFEEKDVPFRNHSFEFGKGDTVFISSDGYPDQGNPKGRRFGTKQMMELFMENSDKPLQEQKKIYRTHMQAYMGGTPQRDDITVFAFRF